MISLNMRTKKIAFAVLLALPLLHSYQAAADEAPAAVAAAAPSAPASPWTLSTTFNLTSDYYARGASQSWHRPAVQGSIDIGHSSGFYAGVFGSSISERTYVGASTEIDLYAGYNGTFGAVEGLGYTVGVIGYLYPSGGWDKYVALTLAEGNKGVGNQVNESFNTWEANVGLSYKWLSAKLSYGLTNWYGAQKSTGWTKDSDGSLYYELNALVPLPIWGLNLIAHVGYSDIQGELSTDPLFANANYQLNGDLPVETNADWADYKIGLSKTFAIAGAEGFNGSLVYTGGSNGGNSGYWGKNGYGSSSFTTTPGSIDSTDGRLILTVGRTF